MTYQIGAATATAAVDAVYFVGPGAAFSRVVLRTVETELDGPTQRVADLDALRFARMTETGTVKPAHMVVVHETAARSLLAAIDEGAEFLPQSRIAVAFEDEHGNESADGVHFADLRDALLARRVSFLPMNTNVTNWIRLLQVIHSGGQYVPPELFHPVASPAGDAKAAASAAAPGETETPVQAGAPRPQDAARDITAGDAAMRDASLRDGAESDPRGAAARRPEGRIHPGSVRGGRGPALGSEPVHKELRAPDRLTPREAEVLEMAAAGRPNKLIAGELELSEHTVKLYMHRIIGKLGVRNRTEAAVWYHQNGRHA